MKTDKIILNHLHISHVQYIVVVNVKKVEHVLHFVLKVADWNNEEKRQNVVIEKPVSVQRKVPYKEKSRKYQGVFEVKSQVKYGKFGESGLLWGRLEHNQVQQWGDGTRCPEG